MKANLEPKSIGSRIQMLRKEKGITQNQLGEEVGLSQHSISKIEAGTMNLTIDNLFCFANYFNVSFDFICIGENRDSILSLLNDHVSLAYETTSYGEQKYRYPLLHIDKNFFDYLMQQAKAKLNDVPESVSKFWIEEAKKIFYENKKEKKEDEKKNKDESNNNMKSSKEVKCIVPLPEGLLFPDDEKRDWKQTDLLAQMDNQLYDDSNIEVITIQRDNDEAKKNDKKK